jgi:hypothetical protein
MPCFTTDALYGISRRTRRQWQNNASAAVGWEAVGEFGAEGLYFGEQGGELFVAGVGLGLFGGVDLFDEP